MTVREAHLRRLHATAVSEHVEYSGLLRLEGFLLDVIDRFENTDRLLFQIGGLLSARSRARITRTKTDPDGKPWKPWSASYAKTRTARNSLLRDSDDMLRSIQHIETDDTTAIFATEIYAGVQNSGSTDLHLPERRFIGLGADDITAIEDMALSWLAGGRKDYRSAGVV